MLGLKSGLFKFLYFTVSQTARSCKNVVTITFWSAHSLHKHNLKKEPQTLHCSCIYQNKNYNLREAEEQSNCTNSPDKLMKLWLNDHPAVVHRAHIISCRVDVFLVSVATLRHHPTCVARIGILNVTFIILAEIHFNPNTMERL